ncbi:MAG: radical SAM protein [Elusimicrobia bacterium]|nr:radical SAM protein [Elusimicrobiota bacterium]
MCEIKKIKLALTSSCTLACNHCKIEKNKDITLDFDKAKSGIDILFNSPGKYKRLEIYGGEPFLKFDLMKKIVSYAKKRIAVKKKKLSISVATNATLLDNDKISWIKDNHINVSVSFSGSEESHNYNRMYSNGRGSFSSVSKKIDFLIKNINSDYLVCLYCVDGSFADSMREDFKKIISKGFKIINVECVSGRGWGKKNYEEFKDGMNFILNIIDKEMKNGNFIFLEPFMEMLYDRKSWDYNCPKYRDLEMYPDGNLGFYPFAFIKYSKVFRKISIGNWKNGLIKKYKNCFLGCEKCNDCVRDYYILPGLSDGSFAYEIRSALIKKFFYKILKNKKEKNISAYLEKLKVIFNKTYE